MKIPIALLFCAAAAMPATRPDDVNGWKDITWARTLDSVKTPESHTCGTYCITLPDAKVGSLTLKVSAISAPDSERVSRVVLCELFGTGQETAGSGADFDTLKLLLIEKYGAPSTEDRAGHSVSWLFPSTAITLNLDGGMRIGHILLIYKAVSKADLGAL